MYALQRFFLLIYGLSYPLNNVSFFFFFAFLGLHLWHMKVPRLGVESEL